MSETRLSIKSRPSFPVSKLNLYTLRLIALELSGCGIEGLPIHIKVLPRFSANPTA